MVIIIRCTKIIILITTTIIIIIRSLRISLLNILCLEHHLLKQFCQQLWTVKKKKLLKSIGDLLGMMIPKLRDNRSAVWFFQSQNHKGRKGGTQGNELLQNLESLIGERQIGHDNYKTKGFLCCHSWDFCSAPDTKACGPASWDFSPRASLNQALKEVKQSLISPLVLIMPIMARKKVLGFCRDG